MQYPELLFKPKPILASHSDMLPRFTATVFVECKIELSRIQVSVYTEQPQYLHFHYSENFLLTYLMLIRAIMQSFLRTMKKLFLIVTLYPTYHFTSSFLVMHYLPSLYTQFLFIQ